MGLRDGRDHRWRGSGRARRPRVVGDGDRAADSGSTPCVYHELSSTPTIRSTSSTRAARRGVRRAHPCRRPQHPQRRQVARNIGYRSSTGCASPCRSTTASAWVSGISGCMARAPRSCTPRRASTPSRRSGVRRRSLHRRVRRPHDVHRHTRSPSVRRVRTFLAAHGDHGGRAVSGRRSSSGSCTTCTPARSASGTA